MHILHSRGSNKALEQENLLLRCEARSNDDST